MWYLVVAAIIVALIVEGVGGLYFFWKVVGAQFREIEESGLRAGMAEGTFLLGCLLYAIFAGLIFAFALRNRFRR